MGSGLVKPSSIQADAIKTFDKLQKKVNKGHSASSILAKHFKSIVDGTSSRVVLTRKSNDPLQIEPSCLDDLLDDSPLTDVLGSALTHLFLGGQKMGYLTANICNLGSLIVLDLFRNELTILPSEIGQLENLETLNLSSNLLRTLPKSIENMTALRTLDVAHNQLADIGECDFSRLKSLQRLRLINNKLESLPRAIFSLENLEGESRSGNTKLSVENNPINAPPIEIILEGFGRVREYFHDVDKALAAGEAFATQEAPDWYEEIITACIDSNAIRSRFELAISGRSNKLNVSEQLLRVLPEKMFLFAPLGSNVTHLDLSGNEIVRLPREIGSMEKLVALDVSRNKLLSLPAVELSQLNLKIGVVSQNPFMEKLPQGIALGSYHGIIEYLLLTEDHAALSSLKSRPPKDINCGKMNERLSMSTQEEKEHILNLALKLCKEWAFVDINDEKMNYLRFNIFPLKIWTRENFQNLQEVARAQKANLEVECKEIVKKVSDEASDPAGHYICNCLDHIEATIFNGKRDSSSDDINEESWLPEQWTNMTETLPPTLEAIDDFDTQVLPQCLHLLAKQSLPHFAEWIENMFKDMDVEVRTCEKKCVKSVERTREKVCRNRRKNTKQGIRKYPVSATVGDALRCSVTAATMSGVKNVWERLKLHSDVIRMKNKFRESLELGETTRNYTFPNLHVNILHQSPNCAPMVCEVQIHLSAVLEGAKQDHRLYEIVRAAAVDALVEQGAYDTIRRLSTERRISNISKT